MCNEHRSMRIPKKDEFDLFKKEILILIENHLKRNLNIEKHLKMTYKFIENKHCFYFGKELKYSTTSLITLFIKIGRFFK